MIEKILFKIFLIFGLLYIGLIIYFNRSLYLSKFDQVYWKDKYEHSQWKLPMSNRILGDDGLYLYEGYRLIHGEDPTLLNAEVPPICKYLIGLSIIIFGNGYIYGFIVTFTALILFYFLSIYLFKNKLIGLLTTLALLTDSIITNQFDLTMLDSFQLLCLISTFLFTYLFLNSQKTQKKTILLVLTGISFGLFSGSKAPIFSPLLSLVILYLLYKSKDRLSNLSILAISAFLAYLLPYINYFLMGHNFRQWLGVQKWILSFYKNSFIHPNYGSAISTLTVGKYQNLFTRIWDSSDQFSLVWPIITVISLIVIIGQTSEN
jgi:predicted membrane-bound dolichyl-phosphate-mannose-protein mannosyltransferase